MCPFAYSILPAPVVAQNLLENAAKLQRTDSEYLSHPDNADLSTGDIDFSAAIWYRSQRNTPGDTHALFTKQNSGASTEYNLFRTVGNQFSWGVANSVFVTHATVIVPGTWYLIVVYHDSAADEIGISINGGAFTTQATGGTAPVDSAATFRLGAINSGLNGLLDGRLAGAGWWKNRVLTVADALELYNSGDGLRYDSLSVGLLASLTSYWNLDEASGTRVDSHGSNDLTDNNTVLDHNGPAFAEEVLSETANQLLWWKADLGVRNPTDECSEGQFPDIWDDQSGSGNDGDGLNTPVFRENGIGTRLESFECDGGFPGDHVLLTPSPNIPDGGDWSIYTVFQSTLSNKGCLAEVNPAGASSQHFGLYLNGQASGEITYLENGGSSITGVITGLHDGLPHVVAIVNSGGTVSMYVDGVADGSVANANTWGTPHEFNQGFTRSTTGDDYIGHIAETIVYDVAHNGTQRGNVETYLTNKWGI